jgi:hypothetical protein
MNIIRASASILVYHHLSVSTNDLANANHLMGLEMVILCLQSSYSDTSSSILSSPFVIPLKVPSIILSPCPKSGNTKHTRHRTLRLLWTHTPAGNPETHGGGGYRQSTPDMVGSHRQVVLGRRICEYQSRTTSCINTDASKKISIGAGFDIVIAGGSPGLRSSSPAMATLISALTFPTGFVLIILRNTELCASYKFIMAYSTLRRRTSLYDLARNWIVSYIFKMVGCLFYARILSWWAGVLTTEAQTQYAVTQSQGRVSVNWGYNVSRVIMCNWLVGLAFFFAPRVGTIFRRFTGSGLRLLASLRWAIIIPSRTSSSCRLACSTGPTSAWASSYGRPFSQSR